QAREVPRGQPGRGGRHADPGRARGGRPALPAWCRLRRALPRGLDEDAGHRRRRAVRRSTLTAPGALSERTSGMAFLETRRLVIAGTLANSYLAILGLDRALIAMPAWQKTGPLAWAAFSRHADNGPVALILYPTLGFAGLVLVVLAAIGFTRDGRRPR